MSQDFYIKARVAQQQVELQVSAVTTGRQIKEMLAASLNLDPDLLRLICQGKVINDEDTAEKVKLKPGFVVQAMKISNEVAVSEPSEPSSPRLDPLLHLQNILNSLPPSVLFDSSTRTRSRPAVPREFKLEAIRQNLMTVEVLIETRARPWRWTNEESLFSYRRRRLQPGQWVDVRDTMDAWLEAQVLEVAATTDTVMVRVHYNEWPPEWDEWLEMSSPRIQPFRAYTGQAVDSPVQSPFPVVQTEDVFLTKIPQLEVSEYFAKAAELQASVQPLISSYLNKSRGYIEASDSEDEDDHPPRAFIEKVKQGQQLGIILDRLGRAISDLALFVETRNTQSQEPLEPMPALNDPRLVDQDSEIRIHAIFAPRSFR